MTPGERRRVRSRLNLAILRVLAQDVAAPILVNELVRVLSLREQFVFVDQNPSRRSAHTYRYLYRLAAAGLVRMQGLRRQKRIALTPKGARSLPEWERASDSTGAGGQGVTGRRLAEVEKAARKMSRQDRFHGLRRMLARSVGLGKRRAAFISYDIPERLRKDRARARRCLLGFGFIQLNGSYYVGPPARLRPTLERMEDLGVMPYCCWGEMILLPP
ncbi:MAG: hypothetical protein HYY13_03820 [Nitrospirae bacterium]|nr:hypothetical protein [Nitrospirota bacterium]